MAVVAATTAGQVRGVELAERGAPVFQFRHVPYAADAGGANRFRQAQPIAPWAGVRDCTAHGPIALQPPSALESLLGAQQSTQSEDCLSLTVTTPNLDGARPVLVWIHGGAFVGGSGSTPWYDGESFARNGDVVVVTINYRLGAFGFMHVAHLLGDAYAESGSLGISDQIAALEWVRHNIAAFGGDPNRVTIFGESAGGMSVGCLLGSPRAQGLFATAIAQSGAAHNATPLTNAEEVTALMLSELGLTAEGADGLLALDGAAITAAQTAATLKFGASRGGAGISAQGMPFQPSCGTATLPDQPIDAIRRGSAANVRVVTGTTTEEFKLFSVMLAAQNPLDEARLLKRATRTLGDKGAELAELYTKNRAGQTPDDVWSALVTDFIFRIPAIRMLEAQAEHRDDVFLYEFGHQSTAWGGKLGACHAIEIPFVFDNVHKGGVSNMVGEIGEVETSLATETNAAWLDIANGDEPWARYDTSRRATRRFGGAEAGVLDDPAGDERILWEGLR